MQMMNWMKVEVMALMLGIERMEERVMRMVSEMFVESKHLMSREFEFLD